MKKMLNRILTHHAINLPRPLKRALAIFLDIILCIFATWITLCLQLEEFVIINSQFAIPTLVSIGIVIPMFISWGLYRTIFRFSGSSIVKILAKTIALYTLIYTTIFAFFSVEDIPRSIGLIQPMMLFLLVGSSRWLVKTWLGQNFYEKNTENDKKGIIIYGAGNAGQQLATSLMQSNEFRLVSFVDNDKNFWGNTIDGNYVNSPAAINRLIKEGQAKELWLAIPEISSNERRKLINVLRKLPLHVRTLPSFSDLASGRIRVSDVRELDVDELLGRDAVKPNKILLRKCIYNKVVMVTGAGGSIGSELCRQVLTQKPSCVLLVENSEISLYNIHSELQSMLDSTTDNFILLPLLVDVQDENKLSQLFKTWTPQTVYHAAAYKHVPMVEHNVVAGISNNVIGTINCAKIALAFGVEDFVLISTDKAVRPTNIMGASKRLAEMALQSLASSSKQTKTRFSMVRFGNVLGSSGSVVPLFRKQILSGGPVTVTDEEVTRYFMTIPEAAQLVIQAGAMADGGEVFVLDMGEPVYIINLARNMIETSGLTVKDKVTPWGDIEIKVTGMRPGEKLYEELIIGNDVKPTKHPRILQARENFMKEDDFFKFINKLKNSIAQNNILEIRELLIENVSGFAPNADIVDWVHTKFSVDNS